MAPVRREIAAISRLAAPMTAAQVGTVMLWVVDLMMIGAVGVMALDAVSLGRLWIMGTVTFAMGVVMGVDPLIAQAHGAGDRRVMSLTLQRGLALAMIMSLPTGAVWLFTEEFLRFTGQDAGLSAAAEAYVLVQLPGIPFFLAFVALRQYLMDREIVAPCMWVILVANGVNAAANWALIYGHLGFPPLGATGAGIATTVTQVCMAVGLGLWIVVGKLNRDAWTGWSREALRRAGILRVFRYGLPVGVQIALELWGFMLANLLAGWIGPVALASHTIVLTLASFTFMVPLGISFGVVTRVGNLIGAGRPGDAQRAAWVGYAMGAGVMTVAAAVFVIGRWFLPTIFSRQAEVVATCAALLPIAAAFQVFDGIQVVGGGILRGMGRPRPAAAFNLVGYYVLALPVAYWLAFVRGMGLPGIWWGLTAGLAAVALLLLAWVAARGPARVDARIVGEAEA